MNKIKTLAGEAALYGLGSIIPRMLNFFLVVLHTRIFLPEAYGTYINLYAWVAILNVIYLFGMETAYFRFATKAGADEQKVFRITQTFVLAISLSISLLIFLFSIPLSNELNVPGHADFIAWLSILMFVDAAVSIPFARLRLRKKAALFASAKLINVAIQVGLNLYFLLVIYQPSIGIGYLLLANLIANLFYLFFFAKTLITWRPAYDKELFSSMFKYAYPIMLTGLAGMTNETFSRIMLVSWLPENFYPGKSADYALGIFGACYRFSVIMNLAVQAFRFAAEPFFFSNASHKDSPWLFAKVNHYFTILCCFIVLSVVINLDILKYLLDEKYWEGLGIVPILLTGVMFLGIYYNFSVWFKLTDRTHYGTLITVGGVVLTVVLNYFLIPMFGYLGSSWATLTCYFAMAISCYVLGQKYYPIPYKLVDELGYLFFALILIQVSKLVSIENQLLSSGFHIIIMVFFLAITFWRERNYWQSSVS
ncbi:polysaccharide biosynthesis C-terminal domain-containing protein [soil metagenome]